MPRSPRPPGSSARSRPCTKADFEALFDEVREHGIKVTAILPGPVNTEQLPPVERARVLRPADIAAAVLLVLTAPPGACPAEIVLEPLHVPEA